jgi:hypothetical protein
VVIYDYSCCEVMINCLDHEDATGRIMDELDVLSAPNCFMLVVDISELCSMSCGLSLYYDTVLS